MNAHGWLNQWMWIAIILLCAWREFEVVCRAGEEVRFRSVRISNQEPRRDTAGEIIDAHDGNLQFFDGRYYLYGTAYAKTAGYSINNRFRVYSSPDLEHWFFDGELLMPAADGAYYRPYVVFNPNTKKYVLWYNWYPRLWDGQTAVALSDTPIGPFTVANANIQLSQAKDHPGDGSLFVDDDGTGYFIYTVIGQDHAIRIEKLNREFTASTGETSAVLGTNCEAPALFRRGERYYAVFDQCCCFCTAGSGAEVHVAAKVLGPYTRQGNINRDGAGKPNIAAQQTFVTRIPTSNGPAFLWMGDRWGSRPDGIKGHDFQYWSAPLRFAADGSVAAIENQDSWNATIQVGPERAPIKDLCVWPKKRDPHPLKIDPCLQIPLPPDE